MSDIVLQKPISFLDFQNHSLGFSDNTLEYNEEPSYENAWSVEKPKADISNSIGKYRSDAITTERIQDLLNDINTKFQNMIEQLINKLLLSYDEEITRRLLELNRFAIDEDINGEGISIESLLNFTEFIKTSKWKLPPLITLTPENYIYVTWKKEKEYLFSIEFMPSGEVSFVIFLPTEGNKKKRTRLSGITTITSCFNIVEASIKNWLIN